MVKFFKMLSCQSRRQWRSKHRPIRNQESIRYQLQQKIAIYRPKKSNHLSHLLKMVEPKDVLLRWLNIPMIIWEYDWMPRKRRCLTQNVPVKEFQLLRVVSLFFETAKVFAFRRPFLPKEGWKKSRVGLMWLKGLISDDSDDVGCLN